jgi:hypothetical protein
MKKNKFSKPTYPPRVRQSDILDFMDASNISRMHLGLDPLPYLWYKKTIWMGRSGMMKFLDKEKSNIVLAYCYASRRQRREIPKFHECYMLVLSILKKNARIEEMDRQIEEMERQIEELKKSRPEEAVPDYKHEHTKKKNKI